MSCLGSDGTIHLHEMLCVDVKEIMAWAPERIERFFNGVATALIARYDQPLGPWGDPPPPPAPAPTFPDFCGQRLSDDGGTLVCHLSFSHNGAHRDDGGATWT